jgi:ribosomal peptide maturation radical SAM protein 1
LYHLIPSPGKVQPVNISNAQNPFRVALVSAPWPFFSRPSIQLGTLKAYIGARFPGVQPEAHHVYLDVARRIGYRRYHDISERMWTAEPVFAALLYPELQSAAEKLFGKGVAGKQHVAAGDFGAVVASAAEASAEYVRRTEWRRYGLVGFSMSLCQMTATLYLIRQIKQRCPKTPVVVGGAPFHAATIPGLLRVFPEIDAVVTGEGERPLGKIVGHLLRRRGLEDFPATDGVVTRYAPRRGKAPGFFQVPDLDRLPFPDYDDYFRQLESFGPEKTFFPTLPVEFSRGCWWRSPNRSGRTRGCTFCNLNLQWRGYRAKSPKRAAAEIDALTSRYRTVHVALTDNLLPRHTSAEIFERLGAMGKDLALFAELRPTTSFDLLRRLRAAGVREVQIGIEALSSRLLRRLNKGTSAIRNLETMKHCESLGIVQHANLILNFPGSRPEDVRQTLRALEFALPYHPLKIVRFWLGTGSRVDRTPETYGLQAVFNHPRYRSIFPADVVKALRLPVQGYRGDRAFQLRLWKPVEKSVREWQKAYAALKRSEPGPILGYRDGREFLLIRQRRMGGDAIHHRLTGTSRRIYLFCGHNRSLEKIRERFPDFSGKQIVGFLNMMVAKRLMFEENGRYLSLAVPTDGRICARTDGGGPDR